MTKGIQHRAKALAFRLQTVRRVCALAFECDSFAGDVAFYQSARKHSFRVAFFGSFLFDKRNEQEMKCLKCLKFGVPKVVSTT